MMGTDILLLEPQGDAAYLKQDAASAWSQLLIVQGMPFAKDFTLKQFRKEMAAAAAGNMRPPSQPAPRPTRLSQCVTGICVPSGVVSQAQTSGSCRNVSRLTAHRTKIPSASTGNT